MKFSTWLGKLCEDRSGKPDPVYFVMVLPVLCIMLVWMACCILKLDILPIPESVVSLCLGLVTGAVAKATFTDKNQNPPSDSSQQ